MKKLIVILALALVALGGCRGLHTAADVDRSDYERTEQLIKKNYVKPDVKDSELFYGAVRGLVQSLNDPYSNFMDPKAAKRFMSMMSGSFSGIGARLGEKDGKLTVIAPLAGSPAEKAGLRGGDVIIAIDGVKTFEMMIDDAVSRIQGAAGTAVTITVVHDGAKEPVDIPIVRAEITSTPVKWSIVTNGGKKFAVITLSEFMANADVLFLKASGEAIASGVNGIVLDLRNDPGGTVDVAGNIICAWTPDGAPFVIFVSRDGKQEPKYCENVPSVLDGVPTVVLVNKGSASASEIAAGALQDYGKARVIGETTFGKGCAQAIIPYPDGSILRLTTDLWLTPKGRSINKTGITPDEIVKANPDDIEKGKDAQLDRAIQYLSNGT